MNQLYALTLKIFLICRNYVLYLININQIMSDIGINLNQKCLLNYSLVNVTTILEKYQLSGKLINIRVLFTVDENIIATTKIRNNYCHLIIHFSNIAIVLLDFSLLLPIKLSLLILFATFLFSVLCLFFMASFLKLS